MSSFSGPSLGDRLDSLSLEVAIDRLLHRQGKSWGCFRVVEEDRNLYRLEVDGQPSLSLQLGSDGYTYRAWWGHKGTTAVVVRKRQPKLTSAKVGTKTSSKVSSTAQSLSSSRKNNAPSGKTPGNPELTPLTYEIQWRSDARSIQQKITWGLVQAIEGRIHQLIDELPDDEPKPRVTVTLLD